MPALCQQKIAIDTIITGPHSEKLIYSHREDPIAAGELKNGKKDGLWTGFYTDGSIRYTSNYKAGKINGQSSYFYSGGSLKSSTQHKDGIRTGKWNSYYENGPVLSEILWNAKGLPTLATLYSESGFPLMIKAFDYSRTECTIQVERFYRNGSRLESYTTFINTHKYELLFKKKGLEYLLDTTPNFGLPKSTEGLISGYYYRYFNSGKLWMHLEFDEGKLIDILNQNSAPGSAIEAEFKKGNGTLVHFHHYGDTAAIYNYKDGLPHGQLKFFYSGNNTHSTGEMTNGVPSSLWTIRSYSGKIKYTLDYHSDTTLWTLYGPINHKYRLYPLLNGVLHGKGSEYDFYEQIAAEFAYKDGLLDGDFKRYLNGNMTRYGSYYMGEQIGNWTTVGLFNPVSHITPFDQKSIEVNTELLPRFNFSLLPDIEMPRLKLPVEYAMSSYSRELTLYSEDQLKTILMELPDSDVIIGTTIMKLEIDENGNLKNQLPVKTPSTELLNFSQALITEDALFTSKFVLGFPDIAHSYVIIEHLRELKK